MIKKSKNQVLAQSINYNIPVQYCLPHLVDSTIDTDQAEASGSVADSGLLLAATAQQPNENGPGDLWTTVCIISGLLLALFLILVAMVCWCNFRRK